MVQKFRVVKYERSTSMGATTTQAQLTTITTRKKRIEICKDGFSSKEDAENYQKVIEERNLCDYFEVEPYS